jgi:hypothetical protein
MNILGALTGSSAHAGRQVFGHDVMTGARHSRDMERKEGNDIAEAQQVLSEKLSRRLAEKLASADTAQTSGANPAPTIGDDGDFSPAKVSDRILGFIETRLAQEEEAGATDETLRQRLQQGVDGFLKGMQEAREELESRGMFNDTVRDNYFETFGRVQQGLDDLKAALGNGGGERTPVTAPPAVAAPTVRSSGAAIASEGVAISASREFAMEITTRDGDVVKINVASARAFSSATSSLSTDNTSASAFSAEISGEDSFSFSVEGELDEGEMQALNDLFAQVNDVAETFYGGDVEAAFNQAMSIGYDQNELAGFAANMLQTQTIAVTQTYAEVARAGGGNAGQDASGPLAPLIDFARDVRNADHALKSGGQPRPGHGDLFRQLLENLPLQTPPDNGAGEGDTVQSAAEPVAAEAVAKQTTRQPWQQFIDGLLSNAA